MLHAERFMFKDENSQSDVKAQGDERGLKLTQDQKSYVSSSCTRLYYEGQII